MEVPAVGGAGGGRLSRLTFQISLDHQDLDEAVEMARLAVEAGVDVLEAGTILILSEGARRVIPRLRDLFPSHPVVADVKCIDGVGHEVGLMFQVGAAKATVMAAASDASIRAAVLKAARYGGEVMVDKMGAGGPDGSDVPGHVAAAKRARDLGAHYAVIHLGYDERSANRSMVDENLLLRWAEAVARENLGIPLQVVGGLTLSQARELPKLGIRDIVISMNLGSAPAGDLQYDQVTGFTVDLHDTANRFLVTNRIREFIETAGRDSSSD